MVYMYMYISSDYTYGYVEYSVRLFWLSLSAGVIGIHRAYGLGLRVVRLPRSELEV